MCSTLSLADNFVHRQRQKIVNFKVMRQALGNQKKPGIDLYAFYLVDDLLG